jgi:hypothetical protein
MRDLLRIICCAYPTRQLMMMKRSGLNRSRKPKKHQGRYFIGMTQGKKQNLVISSGFKAVLCHKKMNIG